MCKSALAVHRDILIKIEKKESNGSKVTIFEILPKDYKSICFNTFVIFLKSVFKKRKRCLIQRLNLLSVAMPLNLSD